ncbi:MAG: DUF1003 domain-containing protein [Deltaproteobacteria bacterium]|nr:DUF1003 domain-containing protein [Deltaproteobacteria bacterium]
MERQRDPTYVCVVCGERKSHDEMMPLEMVRPNVVENIRKERPGLDERGHICLADLHRFHSSHIRDILAAEKGELSDLEVDVVRSLAEHEILSQNINPRLDGGATFGERLSDRITSFGGSWKFIISFGVFCGIWMGINVGLLLLRPFDPYPFILLNLLLSCIAALQAPIIMMSQKRQETRDRLRAEHDYRVNLKAELEIRLLHDKIDHLIMHQWQRLIEIQQIQTDLLGEMMPRGKK